MNPLYVMLSDWAKELPGDKVVRFGGNPTKNHFKISVKDGYVPPMPAHWKSHVSKSANGKDMIYDVRIPNGTIEDAKINEATIRGYSIKEHFFNMPQHGGKREGAGRKPPKEIKKSVNFYITESEKEKLKKYLNEIRE